MMADGVRRRHAMARIRRQVAAGRIELDRWAEELDVEPAALAETLGIEAPAEPEPEPVSDPDDEG